MKARLFLLLIFIFQTFFAKTQTEALNQFFDRYKDDPAFTFAFISKELMDISMKSALQESDWSKIQSVVKNIGSLRILVADSIENAHGLYKEAKNLVPENGFDELLTVRDGQENVRIWVKEQDAMIIYTQLLIVEVFSTLFSTTTN